MSELKSTLRNSSHLSASSRRPEDVTMLRVALFTERGRMLTILLGLQIIHSLCFSLTMLLFWRPRRRAWRVVDHKLKVPFIFKRAEELRHYPQQVIIVIIHSRSLLGLLRRNRKLLLSRNNNLKFHLKSIIENNNSFKQRKNVYSLTKPETFNEIEMIWKGKLKRIWRH